MSKGDDPLVDREGTRWRQGQHWAKRWFDMTRALDEINARSKIDIAANGTRYTPSKMAAAMDAEREADGVGFSTHCKAASSRLKLLQTS